VIFGSRVIELPTHPVLIARRNKSRALLEKRKKEVKVEEKQEVTRRRRRGDGTGLGLSLAKFKELYR